MTPKTESGRAPGTYRTPEGGIEVIVGIEESASYVEDMWPDEVAFIRQEAASAAVAEVLDRLDTMVMPRAFAAGDSGLAGAWLAGVQDARALLAGGLSDGSGTDDIGLSGQASEGRLGESGLDVAGDGRESVEGVVLIEGGQVDNDLDVAPEGRERSSGHADTVQHAVSNVNSAALIASERKP